MNHKLKLFIYGALLLGGGLYLGRMIGVAKTYKETSGVIGNQLFTGASDNLHLHLYLLKLLQANEYEKISQKLENFVDADLLALTQYSEVPLNHRNPEILKSIEKAKEYREKHPSPNASAAVWNKKAFDLVK